MCVNGKLSPACGRDDQASTRWLELGLRERRQNILGPVSRHCLLRGGGGISKSAKVDAGGPKISQLIKFYCMKTKLKDQKVGFFKLKYLA